MRKITIKGKNYFVPGDWNEMTAEQLCFLAVILTQRCTVQEAKLKMLLFCLRGRIRAYRRATGNGYAVSLPGMNVYLTPEQLTVLSAVYDFLFCETDKGVQ